MGSVSETLHQIRLGEQAGQGTPGTSVCSSAFVQEPWEVDESVMDYGLGATTKPATVSAPVPRNVLPSEYRNVSAQELVERITAAKQALGDRVVVLGHFYQRDEIVRYADFIGDSFQLAQAARTRTSAEAIVFCGVHFMAETADILSRPDQAVILPNLAAGCSMADMADVESVRDCWEDLESIYGSEPDATGRVPVIPITYMNSSAALKGFCGEHGGIVCTSSNAPAVLRWAFERGQRVLFFPDQHLGRNTGKAMGIPLDRMSIWNPNQAQGGSSTEELRQSQIILWHGFCSVHKRFTVEQIQMARSRHLGVRILVHPECTMDVVDAADEAGSTDYICKRIESAPAGSVFAVGTEINLVQRLANQHPDMTIFCLDSIVCPCSTMYRTHPSYLAWVLESLQRGEVIHRIAVPENVARPARIALERMLQLQPGASAPVKA